MAIHIGRREFITLGGAAALAAPRPRSAADAGDRFPQQQLA